MRTVLYLRLSDEDRNKLSKAEISESIKNQEKILRNYALENHWDIIGVYQDEDYSGSDRDRPNFNRMIKECECGNVDIVLVKSQARFARDIELIDKYVHNLFYEWNVRFMTYLEKIDNTKKETKKTSQITSMVDEWYIEDTSINIRETLKTKRENGEFTGSFAPYGYKKDPINKNHLIIDIAVSNIIKRIYSEYLNGNGLQTIANKLNNENVLSPLEYKRLNGSKLQIPVTRKFENCKSIKQTGYYKIDVLYFRQNQSNILTYHYLSQNNDSIDSNFKITLSKCSDSNIELYYTTKKINSFEKKKNWKKLKIGETIPNNCTYIVSYIKSLDIIEPINYQFEVYLKENKKHHDYQFFLKHYKNNSQINLKYQLNIRKKYKWTSQTIKKILTNELYIGNLIQFKSTHVSYKNHTVIKNDPTKWIKVNNTHDAIIDYEIWNSVQNKLNTKKRSEKTGKLHPLSNKLFCAYCNKPFIKCGKKDRNGYSYLCCKDKKEKWSYCINQKYMKEIDLHIFLLKKINKLIKTYYDKDILKETANNYQNIQNELNIQKNLEIEKKQLVETLKEKEQYFVNLYESYIKKILSNDEFILLQNQYKKEMSQIKRKLDSLSLKKLCHQNSKIKYITKIKELDSKFINLFVDNIYIGLYNKETNSREITITWNFK